MVRQEDSPVMLRCAQHLDAHADRPFAALRVTGLDLSGDEGLSSSFEPCLNKLSGISEQPPRADKSAMGAINRPLRLSGLICQVHNRALHGGWRRFTPVRHR